jgi:hypothetical protein
MLRCWGDQASVMDVSARKRRTTALFSLGNTVQKHGFAMTPKSAVMRDQPRSIWTRE